MHILSQAHPALKHLRCNRYIDAAINGGPSVQRVSHLRLPAFKATVMDAMPRLVELDSSATAGIVLSSFPQEHAAVVRQLQGSPHLQYRYLKAALQVKILCPCSSKIPQILVLLKFSS